MKNVMNAVTAKNENNSTVVNAPQAAYVKPSIEVIEMEMEGAILSASAVKGSSGSNFNDGGFYGRQ